MSEEIKKPSVLEMIGLGIIREIQRSGYKAILANESEIHIIIKALDALPDQEGEALANDLRMVLAGTL